MSRALTIRQVIGGLQACGEKFSLVELGGDARLVVTRYGGRIMGPFFGDKEECPLWLTPAFAEERDLATLLGQRSWNIGGDRIWVAPELQYNVHDRTRFHPTYDLQQAVDPGSYKLEQSSPAACVLAQEMRVLAFDHQDRSKRLHVARRIRRVDDPLRTLAGYEAISSLLQFAGYEHEVTLSDLQPDNLCSQAWNITQVPPGGVAIVPTVPGLEYSDHLEPADAEHFRVFGNHVRAWFKSDCMFKVELKAAHHFGRSGYFRVLAPGRAVLMVKLSFNNPSEPYVMEAPHSPGVRGYNFDIYHDDGGLGGFGEMECHGRPVGGEAERTSSTDQFVNWFYVGREAAVKKAALHLLGVEI
jgi:hypothetical protein